MQNDLWLLCEKAWGTLGIKQGKKNVSEYGEHPRHGRVMSLVFGDTEHMYVLGLELEGVIIFRNPEKCGRSRKDTVQGASADQVRKFLKKYTLVS